MKTIRKFQRGLSLVTAIFLLVVMSSLAAVMMTFFSAQQQSSVLDMMGTRAYQAARAGIEWGAYQILQLGGNGAGSVPTLGGSLSGFAVIVTSVSAVPVPIDPAISAVYNLTSTATQGQLGQPDYFERQVSVTLAK
jgi:MSHA biogenesis protein MshP